MYYVYVIYLQGFIYVGCTNNLKRRKDQHNENARKRKSKFGRFLNDYNIVLTKDDIIVIYQSYDRQEALAMEKATAMQYERIGYNLLNDNYSLDCTRKGKNIGNTAKQYYVIDFNNNTVTLVEDLRQYCLQNNYPYKELQRTIHGLRYTFTGHKVFHKEDWENIKNKDYFTSGNFIKDYKNRLSKQKTLRQQKRYKVKFPDGHIEEVVNLDRFATEHNLTSGTLHATYTKQKPTKGYQVIERL